MCIRWSYNYNSVNRWMADRLFYVSGGDLRSRKPFTIFGRLQIRISNDDYLNVGQTTQIAEMRFAHAPNAEERYTDGRASFHLRSPWFENLRALLVVVLALPLPSDSCPSGTNRGKLLIRPPRGKRTQSPRSAQVVT